MVQRYSATASCEPSSDLLKISALSNTNENHALQTQFDQFPAPAVHLPFLASIPDVPVTGAAPIPVSATRCPVILEITLASVPATPAPVEQLGGLSGKKLFPLAPAPAL